MTIKAARLKDHHAVHPENTGRPHNGRSRSGRSALIFVRHDPSRAADHCTR
jgi:hypothetical protein